MSEKPNKKIHKNSSLSLRKSMCKYFLFIRECATEPNEQTNAIDSPQSVLEHLASKPNRKKANFSKKLKVLFNEEREREREIVWQGPIDEQLFAFPAANLCYLNDAPLFSCCLSISAAAPPSELFK
jgi:hypothetical protein